MHERVHEAACAMGEVAVDQAAEPLLCTHAWAIYGWPMHLVRAGHEVKGLDEICHAPAPAKSSAS